MTLMHVREIKRATRQSWSNLLKAMLSLQGKRSLRLEGHVAGKSVREIAVDLCGAERVATEWTADGVLRVQVRRL